MCSDNVVPLPLETGMNAAVRAVTRMGIYVGAQVYLIHEVYYHDTNLSLLRLTSSGQQSVSLYAIFHLVILSSIQRIQ